MAETGYSPTPFESQQPADLSVESFTQEGLVTIAFLSRSLRGVKGKVRSRLLIPAGLVVSAAAIACGGSSNGAEADPTEGTRTASPTVETSPTQQPAETSTMVIAPEPTVSTPAPTADPTVEPTPELIPIDQGVWDDLKLVALYNEFNGGRLYKWVGELVDGQPTQVKFFIDPEAHPQLKDHIRSVYTTFNEVITAPLEFVESSDEFDYNIKIYLSPKDEILIDGVEHSGETLFGSFADSYGSLNEVFIYMDEADTLSNQILLFTHESLHGLGFAGHSEYSDSAIADGYADTSVFSGLDLARIRLIYNSPTRPGDRERDLLEIFLPVSS
ncbi:MAG: hypothetical protein WEB00_12580 [Dehalococcoidia bacterium]